MVMVTFAAVMVPMRTDVGAGLFAISVVGNISYFSFGLLAPLSGWFSDHIGSRRILIICLLGMAVSCGAVALARNIYTLGASLAALGLFAALYHPSGLSLISRKVVAVEKAMAYHGIFGSLGLAAGPLLAGVITSATNWRWAYAAFIVPTAALAAYFAYYARGEKTGHAAATSRRPFPPRTLWAALTFFYLVVVCIGLIFHGTTTFLPTYLGNLKTLFLGNVLTTLTLLAGVAGQYAGGFLAARYRHELVLATSLAACGVAMVGLGVLRGPALLIPAMAFGFSHFATQPVTNSLIARLASARRQGLAYGVNAFCTFGVGSFGTGFAGFVGERYGLSESFTLLGLAAFVSIPLVGVLWLLRRSPANAAERA